MKNNNDNNNLPYTLSFLPKLNFIPAFPAPPLFPTKWLRWDGWPVHNSFSLLLSPHTFPHCGSSKWVPSSCSSMGSSMGCGLDIWSSVVLYVGDRGISAAVPGAPSPPPSSLTFVFPWMFLSLSLSLFHFFFLTPYHSMTFLAFLKCFPSCPVAS